LMGTNHAHYEAEFDCVTMRAAEAEASRIVRPLARQRDPVEV